jgi:transposase-like protein
MIPKFQNLFDLQKVFATEQECLKYLEKKRWKGAITSPFDPASRVYKYANGRYRCKKTGKYFNAKTKTIFENSKIPLWKWFYTLYIFVNHKKGISSCQLAKDISITQKSAWFVLHRLRLGFQSPVFKSMLKNLVEIDETYLGGSNSNRHWDKKVPHSQGRSWKDKTPVLVMIERKGNSIAQVVPSVERNTLEPIIRKHIKEGSNVYTDEWLAYQNLDKWYNHQIVNHSTKQYVKGEASVNSAENFNSCLKRGIYGTYHWVSKKHLSGYTDEFTLRYNSRKYSQQERFDLVLLSSINQRLTYQQLIN